jgi:hypothetical protein
VGVLGLGGAELVGASTRNADGQVGRGHGLTFELFDASGASWPVLSVIVDVEVDAEVGLHAIAKHEVVGKCHDEGERTAGGGRAPPGVDGAGDWPHAERGVALHPA